MKLENAVISAVFALIVAVPLLEALLRRTLHTGISNSASIVQHLTLVVGMLGAALAARENRLLALSSLGQLIEGKGRILASIFGGSCAAAVSVLLAVAGAEFVLAERPSGQILAYGIPVWVVQTVMPLGFGLIALRLVGHSAQSWSGRGVAVLFAGAWIFLWHYHCYQPLQQQFFFTGYYAGE